MFCEIWIVTSQIAQLLLRFASQRSTSTSSLTQPIVRRHFWAAEETRSQTRFDALDRLILKHFPPQVPHLQLHPLILWTWKPRKIRVCSERIGRFEESCRKGNDTKPSLGSWKRTHLFGNVAHESFPCLQGRMRRVRNRLARNQSFSFEQF